MSSNFTTYSVLVTGLGGQGVLLVSKIIAGAAYQTHSFACRTESRGLSQRGGSVCSEVRFGKSSVAPVIGRATADVILSLDALEASRVVDFLKPDGLLITHSGFVPPLHLLTQWRTNDLEIERYMMLNQELMTILASRNNAWTVDLTELAQSVRSERGMNCALIGAASRFLPIHTTHLRKALRDCISPKFHEPALRAFECGLSATLVSAANQLARYKTA